MNGHSDSNIARPARRCAAAGIALAVVLQTMFAALAFSPAGVHGDAFVICTAQGLRTIVLDDRRESPRERGHGGHDCPACVVGHCCAGIALPAALVQARPDRALVSAQHAPPTIVLPPRPAPRGGLASRGPPDGFLRQT